VLLPNGVLFERPVDDATGSITTPERPAAAEAAPLAVPPDVSGAHQAVSFPLSAAPAVVARPEFPAALPVVERHEPPRVRRRANATPAAAQPVPAEPAPRRVARVGQTAATGTPAPAAKRIQVRVMPQPVPPVRAVRPDDAPRLQETPPDPSSVPLH